MTSTFPTPPAPRIRTRTRETIPEPAMGAAGVQITFCASVALTEALLAEVKRRNDAKTLSRDWTVERLIEALLKERLG